MIERTKIPSKTLASTMLVADNPTSSLTMFARVVESTMQGRELRYSQRLRLLQSAALLGIKRFDANLIIAMVEHHNIEAKPPISLEKTGGLAVGTIATFAVVQSIIIAAGWWLIV